MHACNCFAYADIYHGGAASESKVGRGAEYTSLTGGDKKDYDGDEGVQEDVRRCSKGCFPASSPPWRKIKKGELLENSDLVPNRRGAKTPHGDGGNGFGYFFQAGRNAWSSCVAQ